MMRFGSLLSLAVAIASFAVLSESAGLEMRLSDLFVDDVEGGPVAVARAGPRGQGPMGNGTGMLMATCTEDGVFGVGRCSRTYFECQAGEEVPAKQCPEGTAFNNVPGAYDCLPVEEVEECTRATKCRGRRASPMRANVCEQIFANCTRKGEAAVTQPCENGLYFSNETKTCQQREDVAACTCPNPKCADGPGRFAANKKRRYRFCPTKCGPHTTMTCPRRTRFNPESQACE